MSSQFCEGVHWGMCPPWPSVEDEEEKKRQELGPAGQKER